MSTSESSKVPVSNLDSLVKEFIKKRSIQRARLTLFVKHVASCLNHPLSPKELVELKLRVESAKSIYSEINAYQCQLEDITSNEESSLKAQSDYRLKFESEYFSAMADANIMLCSTGDSSKSGVSSSCVKLPTISLPTFDGTVEMWLEFRDTYLSLIHNSITLDKIQKFHYLKSALSGSALEIIKSLQITFENYDIAWGLLQERYDNNDLLVHSYVKSIFTLHSITKESSSQIRKLVDSVSKNLRALKSLEEPTESWTTLLFYLIINKLDSNTQKEWEQHKTFLRSQSNQEIDFDTLLEFLKQKADTLDMIKANHSQSPSTASISNNLNSNKKFQNQHKIHTFISSQAPRSNFNKRAPRSCVLCNGNHSLYACDKFLDVSSSDKLKIVDQYKLCRNCLRASHPTADCYFGPCRDCHKKHNSLLHSELSREDSALKSVLTTQTLTSESLDCAKTSCINLSVQPNHSLALDALESVLLSTAIVEIEGNDSKFYKARALMDSGSENCIITKDF